MSRTGLLMTVTINGNAAWWSLTTPLQRLPRNLVTGQRRPFVTTSRERGAPV